MKEGFLEKRSLWKIVGLLVSILLQSKLVIPEPEPTKLEADTVLIVLFHVKFGDCKIDVAAFPMKIWFAVNVFVPIPHLEIDKVPEVILFAFKVDKDELDAIAKLCINFLTLNH